ncbi:MAG: hypothetical protein ACOYLB_09295 [Phototrophicaceae bacterium]
MSIQTMQADEQQHSTGTEEAEPEVSPWWALVVVGVAIALLGGWATYEALDLSIVILEDWIACVTGQGGALAGCPLATNELPRWRFDLPVGGVMLAGLVAMVLGPIPLIVMLNRYQHWFISLLFYLFVLMPYGLVWLSLFLVGMVAALMMAGQLSQGT